MATIPVSTDSPLGQFTYQISGTNPVNEAVARIGAACELHKFSILHSYDFSEILQIKGFPIEHKVYVYEICRAPMASRMLSVYPGFSPFMPCRIALYEQDGKTVVSTMNMELLLKAVENNTALFEEASGMYQSIKEIMRSVLV